MAIKDRKGKWTYSDVENGHWDKFPVFSTEEEAENVAVEYAKEHNIPVVWIAYLDCPDVDRVVDEYAINFETDGIDNILTDIGCAMDSITDFATECYTDTLEELDNSDKEELQLTIYRAIEKWLKKMIELNKIPLYPSKMIEYWL